MRRAATGLLIAMALAFLLLRRFAGTHPAWGFAIAFTEAAINKVADGTEQGGSGGGAGDDLAQVQIAGRIKEVGAEEVGAEFVGETFGDERERDAAGIGGDDGTGATDLGDAGPEGAFDVEFFGDGFNDPVALGEFSEIVFEVAGRNERRKRVSEEAAGATFPGGFEAFFRGGAAISDAWHDNIEK